jgi:regulator of RNase E activity RraA
VHIGWKVDKLTAQFDSDAVAKLIGRLNDVSSTSLADASKTTTPLRELPCEIVAVRPELKLVGRAITVDASDGLLSMVAALKIATAGDVLVVRGSKSGAVSGELFATEAQRIGVAGIVIDGYCRDRSVLLSIDLPVYARGSKPSAPGTAALPIIQIPLDIEGVTVQPGDYLVGDADGIVVGSIEELMAVIDRAEEIEKFEAELRMKIINGSSLLVHMNYDEHLAALQSGSESKLNFS